MLPASNTFTKLSRGATAAVLALGLALPAPAAALDRHEQGIVAGALGILFIQGLINSSQRPAQKVQPMPHKPVHVQPVGASRSPAAYAFSSYSRSQRRAIQASLARAGYYYGPIDGAFGPGTYNATAGYARDIGAGKSLKTQAGAYGIYDQLLYAR